MAAAITEELQLPEQGVWADAVLCQGPACADSPRRKREEVTVLAGQEQALASSGWASEPGLQETKLGCLALS